MKVITAPSQTEFRKHLDNGLSHIVNLRIVLGPGVGLWWSLQIPSRTQKILWFYEFIVFPVVSGVPCLSSEVNPAGGGGRVFTQALQLCTVVSSHAVSNTIKMFLLPCFSVFPINLLCHTMLLYTYTLHTHIHYEFCGVVQLPVPKCHAVFPLPSQQQV